MTEKRELDNDNANAKVKEPEKNAVNETIVAKKPRTQKEQALRPSSNFPEKGIAKIKKEYIVREADGSEKLVEADDDAAEQHNEKIQDPAAKSKKKRGQNKNRRLGQPREKIQLCAKYYDPSKVDENPCKFGDSCKRSHDVTAYMASKPADIDGNCPNFAAYGRCPVGVKCRWLKSHYKEGKLLDNETSVQDSEEANRVTLDETMPLKRKKHVFERSDSIIKYLDSIVEINHQYNNSDKETTLAGKKDNQFEYIDAPFKPWEKKKLHYERAKVVSPLTTVGNLPYRRLMKKFYDVNVTYSEMALSMPLIQGDSSEWALLRCHKSELPSFGAQIATSQQWQAVKATEIISSITPQVGEINLNSGCPIDLLYKQGAGSGLLDQPAKILRMMKGMNLASKDIPITLKIRMGTKDGSPVAESLVTRLLHANDATSGVPDLGAITLHGRSRQQRYAKLADWDYTAKVGMIVNEFNENQKENKESYDASNRVFFVANGDVYNYQDWHTLVQQEGIDTVMIARGALIKPWIFEEIESCQYLDKSATERLEIIKQYSEYAINHWGCDEYGISVARRFMCEWLSFTYRYIPVGLLERLPNQLNERPPKWKGRNELETLLASGDYKDWIKITEMFLGPAHKDFNFVPKHKSNAY